VAVARGLSLFAPFRERPLRNAALHLLIPFGTDPNALIHWSSFPSDHAAIFLALSCAIFFVSRGAGLLALGYSVLVICLPRIYMGIHYPTDIMAGAVIGISLASLAKIEPLRTAVARPALEYMESSHDAFHAVLFLLTFQIAATFDPVRVIAHGLLDMFNYKP
jgi:undecaprenyl-diphosphatase